MLPVTTERSKRLWGDPFMVAKSGFDSMLNHLFHDGEGAWNGQANYPVDIHEDENHLYVDAELPGFHKDEINVTLENGMLSIVAERTTQDESKSSKHLCERRFTKFARRFTLPTMVDESKVDAKLEDGVLHLTLPKREEVKPRRIELK